MVDLVIRPFGGLFLCLLIGAALIYLPYFVAKTRERVAELRGVGAPAENMRQGADRERASSQSVGSGLDQAERRAPSTDMMVSAAATKSSPR